MDPSGLLARWKGLSHVTRRAVAASGSLLVVLAVVAALLANPSRSALFAAPLHSDQLAEVQQRLAGWDVAFTPIAGNVLVQSKQRNALLLRLSLAGVPHAHVDGSQNLLAKIGALTPQAVIDAQSRNGLSGDIELALRGIDGVRDARVIIAPAKPGYFADESGAAASASVRLRLAPGAHLRGSVVSGLRAFVAASVPGLEPQRVTIIDDRGLALGNGTDGDGAAVLQRSLQSALDGAVGNGATIVRVHIEYDPRTLQSSDVRRVALNTPISSNVDDERYSGAGKTYEHETAQVNHGSETHRIAASAQAGRIERITAAVFVDANRQIDLYQIRRLAAATLGIDPHRGDRLEVATIPFAHPRRAPRDGWWLAYGALTPLLPTLAIAATILLALRWAGAPLEKIFAMLTARSSIARATASLSGRAPAQVHGALRDEPPHAAAAVISALPAATAAAVLDLYPEHERSAIVQRMQRTPPPLLSDMERFVERA